MISVNDIILKSSNVSKPQRQITTQIDRYEPNLSVMIWTNKNIALIESFFVAKPTLKEYENRTENNT